MEPEALARIAGRLVTLKELALRMRCSSDDLQEDPRRKKRDLLPAQDSFLSKAMGKPWCLQMKFVASDEASGFKKHSPEGKAQQREGRPGYCDSQRKH
jgi:hypothetical protein